MYLPTFLSTSEQKLLVARATCKTTFCTAVMSAEQFLLSLHTRMHMFVNYRTSAFIFTTARGKNMLRAM
jgi:non-ribosomal peptide synthetase component F